jgi:MFS family permease
MAGIEKEHPGTFDRQTRIIVLIVSSFASFLVPFMTSASTVSLPAIARQFSMSGVALSWIATSFILASAMFLVPFSRAADIYGRKKIFLLGLILFFLTSSMCALSFSLQMLIACRFCQGIGASMIFGTGVSLLTMAFPAKDRGKVLGINAAAVYTGLLAGPALGGVMTHYYGWQSVFALSAGLSGVLALLTRYTLKNVWLSGTTKRFDVTGSVIYCVSLVCCMSGCSLLPSKAGFFIALLGSAGLVLFWVFEQRTEAPVFDTRLLTHNRVFALSNLTALVNYSATFAVAFLISLYLQYIKGFSTAAAGFIMLCQPLIQTALSPFAGWLSDRFEPRIISSIGMALCCAGLVALVFLSNETSVPSIIARLLLLGTGFALFGPPNTNAVMSSVDKEDYGIAAGTLGTMRLLGQMVSMVIITTVLALHIGRAQIVPQQYGQFMHCVKLAFAIFSVLCFSGIFTSFARGRVR